MTDKEEMVVALTARSTIEAQTVAGILRDEGILVTIPGEYLQDALASTSLGYGEIEVRVPKSFLALAHEAIAAAKRAGKYLEGEQE